MMRNNVEAIPGRKFASTSASMLETSHDTANMRITKTPTSKGTDFRKLTKKELEDKLNMLVHPHSELSISFRHMV